MNNRILELADETLELCASKKNTSRIEKWIKHQNFESEGDILINVHFWRNTINQMWRELVPDSEIESATPTEYFVERTLLQRIHKFKNIDDDDVLLPTIWIDPVVSPQSRMFGIEKKQEHHGVSVKYSTVIEGEKDLQLFSQPVFAVDDEKTQQKKNMISALVEGRVPVKVKTQYLQANPFEYAAMFRSMDDLFIDFLDSPKLVHSMMDMFTGFIVDRFNELESSKGIDPEQTWDFRIHNDRIDDNDNPNSLKNCWVYISDQSAGVVSPKMYKEFIYPYHERIAKLFGKVYYHGCEDLTQKAKYIKKLPNLRRFHISPWSDAAKITEELGDKFIYEVHVHPANHLFAYSRSEVEKDIESLCRQCKENGAVFDLNLSDLETVNNEPEKLTEWAKIARDTVSRLF